MTSMQRGRSNTRGASRARPCRTFLGPLRAYIDGLELEPPTPLTIVVSEFVAGPWWQRFLHNRTGDAITEEFAMRANIVISRLVRHAARAT